MARRKNFQLGKDCTMVERMNTCTALKGLLILLAFGPANSVKPAFSGQLHDAVRSGAAEDVLEVLSTGQDINETDYFLGSPLHLAVVEDKADMVRILLEAGADFDAPSELEARTALLLAADLGNVELVSILLESGADLHARDRSGKQAIHLATISGQSGVVEKLLEAGVNVDSREPDRDMTPLHLASLGGELELVKLLVNAGADLEATDANGRTPFFYSAGTSSYATVGDDRLMRYFIGQGVDKSPVDTAGLTPLKQARSRNFPIYEAIAKALTDLGVER